LGALQANAKIHQLMSRLLEVVGGVPILVSDEGRVGSGAHGQILGQVMRQSSDTEP